MTKELWLKTRISTTWFVVCLALAFGLYSEWPSAHFVLQAMRWVWTAVTLTALLGLLEAWSEWRARRKP